MKNKRFFTLLFSAGFLLTTACSTVSTKSISNNVIDEPEKLYIYEDGSMRYKSRFVLREDVVIYDDGRGGERAAVKVRVPIHPDFYRDSIVVVRVEKVAGDVITQRNSDKMDSVN